MTNTLDLIFDFASPNAYLAYRALPPILQRTGATLNVIPCLLGGIFKLTGNQAPWMTNANVKGKNEYDMLELRRFVEKHRLTKFRMNPHFPPNTLLLMRVLVAAGMRGEKERMIEAGLAAMWEDELKTDDSDIVVGILERAGLDARTLLAMAQEQPVKAKLAANTEAAVARGAFGVPTFFVGDEMFFGKERLPQIEDMLARMPPGVAGA
jgi:2-hydroxychromene-2-carboxylate isomerase